jgi:hypothetical protein
LCRHAIRISLNEEHTAMPSNPQRLPHSGLTVPHTGYTVTAYRGHNAHDGVAFTATLRLHGTIIGTIENTGHGGPDTFFPSTADGYREQVPALESFAGRLYRHHRRSPRPRIPAR